MARTILLADDSVTIQKVVEIACLDEDFRVVSFGNGSDAIARLGEVRPDIVLADVHMPGADGYEVCAAARDKLPGVPVMLLVGTFEVFDPDRAQEVGASGHLKKPFDSQELLRQVKALVGSRTAPAANEAPAETSAAAEPGDWSFAASEAADEEDSWSFEPSAAAPEEAAKPSRNGDEAEAAVDAGEDWEPAPEAESSELLPSPDEVVETVPAAPASADVAVAPEMPDTLEAPPEVELAAEPVVAPAPPPQPQPVASGPLSDDDVERIAQRVVELLGDKAVREVAWEIVPDLAEVLLKARIRELEASVE